ncbi:MAG: hypothetical protein K0U64_09135 [Actinomycetia bacterium]|nr:hypothetical protein [Actinomycetes bacterium]
MSDPLERGVQFPAQSDGSRSTMAAGQETFAVAAEAVDAALARRIRAAQDWRQDYPKPAADLVGASARSKESTLAVAQAGLDHLHATFEYRDAAGSIPLSQAFHREPTDRLKTLSIVGGGSRASALEVPFAGRTLQGSDLRRQLWAWVEERAVEPSLLTSLESLIDNPEWLDLSDLQFVIFGAGAELGPLRHLLAWGAQVWAVDLPRPATWRRIADAVAGTPGVLHVPIPADAQVGPNSSVAQIADVAGADLIRQTPEIFRWLSGIKGPLVIGNYGYADGALNVRLSMACDLISEALVALNPDSSLGFLATPTDAFEVPMDVVDDSRAQWNKHLVTRLTRRPLKLANLFQPNYRRLAHRANGAAIGIADSIVPQQGPNYLLAKRMQRWRAVVARERGTRVSLNVAPATRTQSVVKNKMMAAAFLGASRFGIDVFEPDTCNAVMSALLVRDLRDPTAAANPQTPLQYPAELFVESAAHGYLWRSPYSPGSVLGVAAVLGLFEQAV